MKNLLLLFLIALGLISGCGSNPEQNDRQNNDVNNARPDEDGGDDSEDDEEASLEELANAEDLLDSWYEDKTSLPQAIQIFNNSTKEWAPSSNLRETHIEALVYYTYNEKSLYFIDENVSIIMPKDDIGNYDFHKVNFNQNDQLSLLRIVNNTSYLKNQNIFWIEKEKSFCNLQKLLEHWRIASLD